MAQFCSQDKIGSADGSVAVQTGWNQKFVSVQKFDQSHWRSVAIKDGEILVEV